MEDNPCSTLQERINKARGLLIDNSLGKKIKKVPLTGMEKLNFSLVNLETVLGDIDKEKICIRPYRSGELGHIANRHSALYRLEYDLGDIFEFYLIQGMARFLDESAGKGQIWVIDYSGTVQGSIGIVEMEPDTAQLRWFLIEPEFRGLGLGRKLMETSVNYCSERGYRKVYLWTFDELDAARHLYNNFGFSVTETKTHSPWGREITEERWDLELE